MNTCTGYFITIRTYGSWLHGDSRGTIDRRHGEFDNIVREGEPKLHRRMMTDLKQEPFLLDCEHRRELELRSAGICEYKGWILHAVNARSNHVHFVVSAGEAPENVMSCLKRYLTRHLRDRGLVSETTQIWSRHGSTVYLWNDTDLAATCRYVVEGQDAE